MFESQLYVSCFFVFRDEDHWISWQLPTIENPENVKAVEIIVPEEHRDNLVGAQISVEHLDRMYKVYTLPKNDGVRYVIYFDDVSTDYPKFLGALEACDLPVIQKIITDAGLPALLQAAGKQSFFKVLLTNFGEISIDSVVTFLLILKPLKKDER